MQKYVRSARRTWAGCIRIEQPVQVNDEIAHLRVVDGLLRLGAPSGIGGCVIRVDADQLDLVEILEFGRVQLAQLATDHEMEQLLLGSLSHRQFLCVEHTRRRRYTGSLVCARMSSASAACRPRPA